MFESFLKKASVAALAAAAGLFATASVDAGSLVLGTSGWVASWTDPNLGLALDFQSADAVYIEKFVTFGADKVNGTNIDPVSVVFQKISTNAKPYIVINDEAVVNQTGVDWDGFRMTLLPSGAVQFDAARTDISPPGTGFSIDPFTTSQYSQSNSVLDLGGGLIPAAPIGENVWFPGALSGGLAIKTDNGVSLPAFLLKEMPLAVQEPTPGPVVPLPAAAWSGLSGLIGLGLIKARKSLKGLFA